ncbi:MAG: PAS domain S-box protein [Methylococcaceae bacterium]|nr:PAS domain S-box protein [Methylococcaceae bacterium]
MSFRLKTILGIVFIVGLLLLALVMSSLVYLRDSNQAELQRRAATVANLFAMATKDAVLSADLARLEQLASDFLKNPGVIYVRIADRDHLLVKAGAAKSLQQPFRADSTLDLVDDGVYDTFAIIREAGQDYGRVELGLSVESIQAVINEARQCIVILAALVMGLVALFSWLMVSNLTRQLASLEAASKRVANGEFSPQLPVRGRDEFARVAKSFNNMSEHVGNIYHELQLALSEAKQRGERLQGVVDSVMDGLIAIDKKGSITLFSHSSEQIFGYPADEVMGRNVNMLMPEPYHSAHDQYLQNYLNNGERRIIGIGREVQGLRKDGTLFPMDLSITEMFTADEQGFIGLVRDITQRKQMDEQLHDSESMKKAMLESSLDAIITIDMHGNICEFNHPATVIFGYTLAEVLGESMAELFVPEQYRDAHRQGIQRYLKTGKSNVLGRRFEITALRRTGEEFPIELAITPIRHGEQTYFTAFLRDISESKLAEESLRRGREQAEHASLVKSQFLAMMSHEIRTPLNAILGTQELLADTALDDTQKKYLEMARDAGSSLLTLINDILDLTKVEAGKLELENIVFDSIQVVNEVVQLVGVKAREKNLVLTSAVSPEVSPWVTGDPWRLRQVLLNLLTNAIKFTPSGIIAVKLSPRPVAEADGVLLFEVVDTGIGIAKEVQQGLFELFIQADPSDTRKYGGSGLGLAISKRLVELWGGHMGLDSRPGVGSRFWFSFGSAADAPKIILTHDDATGKSLVQSSAAAHILLVEDSPTNQAVLLVMLRSGGHSVDVADSGTASIAAARTNHYDLIFMDVSMPDMNGMDATRSIRQLGGAAASVPIIAMTAHAVKGYKEMCLAAGMNGYATKPINKKDLLALVEKWCGNAGAEPSI